jgi:hypothetical protein
MNIAVELAEGGVSALRAKAARERRLLGAQAEAVGKAKAGAHQHKANRVSRKPDSPSTLDEAGIDKDLAKDARALAAVAVQACPNVARVG